MECWELLTATTWSTHSYTPFSSIVLVMQSDLIKRQACKNTREKLHIFDGSEGERELRDSRHDGHEEPFSLYNLHCPPKAKVQPVLMLSSFAHYSWINEHKD